MASARASQSCSTERAALFLRNALSLEKAISIGLSSRKPWRSRVSSEERRVWREVEKTGACCFDRLSDAFDFVRRQIVHHRNIAWPEVGHQDPIHVGDERGTIHWTVEE